MDFLFNFPLIYPTNDHSRLACQAQQLLQQIDWTYYTIWREATTSTLNLPGLAWSRGDVNELLPVADECGYMGRLLQQFYEHCSFLPLGFGSMAGEAFASRQNRWASGEELLLQIHALSRQNQQLTPLELALGLQAHCFKTVLCIPLGKGAGVLEIGTTKLVPKSDASMIYRKLGFMNGLATQGTPRGEQIMISSSFDGVTKALPNEAENQYGDPDEQYKSASMTAIYGDTDIFRHPRMTSSYWSSSSTSSSTPSASDQMVNNSNTTFVLNTSPAQVSSMNNEDILVSPASSLQATPKSMVNSFDELHILNQLGHIDMHGVPFSLPEFDSYALNNADSIHFSHDHHLDLSDPPLYFPSTNVPDFPPLMSLPDNLQYLDPHSEPNTHQNHPLDCVLQPIQCALSARNDAQVDAHQCVHEIVGGPSKMACQTEVTSLPSVTCQGSNHSASYRNDQQQRWRYMFRSTNEGERMTGQSERHAHAMVSAAISKIPLAENSLGDKRFEGNIDHEIMQKQGAALIIERLVMGMSSKNSEGYGACIGDKMSNDQGEKVVVSSTVTLTTQPAGSYVSYASGSAEAEKVVASSTEFTTSYKAGTQNGTGNRDDHYILQQGAQFLGLQQLQVVQQDDQYIESSFTNTGTPHESNVNLAQVHHMHAERNRRRKQGDCIKNLHTLLPSITKKDKVTILEGAIRRIKELQHLVCELEQENSTLMNISFKEERKSSEDSSHYVSRSQHATIVENSRSQHATCHYVEDTVPHFQLSLIKNVQDVEVDAIIIEIMNALEKRNLYCYEINSKFWKNTKLSIKIMAHYKGGGSYSPTLDEVQDIKQWWQHLIKY